MPTYRLVSLKGEHGFIGKGAYLAYIADLWAESFVYRGYVTHCIWHTVKKIQICSSRTTSVSVWIVIPLPQTKLPDSSQICQNWEFVIIDEKKIKKII